FESLLHEVRRDKRLGWTLGALLQQVDDLAANIAQHFLPLRVSSSTTVSAWASRGASSMFLTASWFLLHVTLAEQEPGEGPRQFVDALELLRLVLVEELLDAPVQVPDESRDCYLILHVSWPFHSGRLITRSRAVSSSAIIRSVAFLIFSMDSSIT